MQNAPFRRSLPCELIFELSKWIRLKIFTKNCIKPLNSALLLTNSSLATFLLPRIENIKQILVKFCAGSSWDSIESAHSLDDLRLICLGQLVGCIGIKYQMESADFEPVSFLTALTNFLANTSNPETIINDAQISFSCPSELIPSLKGWGNKGRGFLIAVHHKKKIEENGLERMKICFKKE